MNSIPWDRFMLDYNKAFQNARADWTTMRLGLYDADMVQGREWWEEFVSRICTGVRIRHETRRWNDDDGDDDAREDEDAEDDMLSPDDVPVGMDVVVQPAV